METERYECIISRWTKPDQTKNPKQAFPSFLFDTTAPHLVGLDHAMPARCSDLHITLVLGDIDLQAI